MKWPPLVLHCLLLQACLPVCFLVNRREIKRFKNIEIPDEVKELEYSDFRFDVPEGGGAITFKLMFDEGVLPETWPEARTRQHRTSKPEPMTEAETEEPIESEVEQAPAEESPAQEMIASYSVTGDKRKALVNIIAAWLKTDAVYMKAPTYAYRIGEYTVDREGTLTGPLNDQLVEFLASQGYMAGFCTLPKRKVLSHLS